MSIECHNVIKEFGNPPQRILHDINITINSGEFVSISGRSGSGKSTLLYIISTLDSPSSGIATIDGANPAEMTSDELHNFRNKKIGFVFQFHNLLPELTALENVLLPARRFGEHKEHEAYGKSLLEEFGIGDKANKFPGQLSGGEQQRVAIARSLIMEPEYIFADEPTGSLDSKNGRIVMDLLIKKNKELKSTIVMVTHEADFAAMADREIYLLDGRVSSRTD